MQKQSEEVTPNIFGDDPEESEPIEIDSEAGERWESEGGGRRHQGFYRKRE